MLLYKNIFFEILNVYFQDLDPDSDFENDAEKQSVDTKNGTFRVSWVFAKMNENVGRAHLK